MVEDLENLIETGETGDNLRSLSYGTNVITQLFRRGFKKAKDDSVCMLCRAAARVLIGYRRSGATDQELYQAANQICIKANIEKKVVCEGAIRLNTVSVEHGTRDTLRYYFTPHLGCRNHKKLRYNFPS